jgi:tetratricopeptide (TPR) repeat protein
MAYDFKGFVAVINEIEGLDVQSQTPPTSIDGNFMLAMDNAQALVNLAVAEIALGRPEKALAHLDRALTLEDPPRFEIYFHQGVARSKLQRLEEAITWYKESEELDPGHGHLLFNMAVTFDRLGRYEEALDGYRRFLKTDSSSSPRERREVEARIGVLVAYLADEPALSTGRGTHLRRE